ncbi:MAG: nucleotidyl transferase AbiEii/AbiGii toxin family protein [Thermodesulfovibrionales bacterium]|nr:nucleotidyl transferase AbiEii/AbiGii toxin family protein [Thermodesulfovibrionales bacterium]
MFYEKVLRKLLEKKVRFAVTGGVALVMHGVVRFTADIDLIVDLRVDNLKILISAIEDLGFKPRIPVNLYDLLDDQKRFAWINEKNMIAFTLYNPEHQIEEIDILIKELIPFEELAIEIEWMKVKDMAIPVVSRNHLKRLKVLSGRAQDMADIKALESLEDE